MVEDLKKLYDGVSSQLDIGDYNTFVQKMQTPDDRKKFYDAVSGNGLDLGDYNQYEQRLSSVKKKDNTTPVQKDGSQNGSVSASTLPSNLSEQVKGIMGIGKSFPTIPQNNIGLKTTKQEQKFISAKNPKTNQVFDDYRTIVNQGIRGQNKMDNTYNPLSQPIVEQQTKKEVQPIIEKQKAKQDTRQNILAVIPELAQAKNTDEAISTILKSDMKDQVDLWQQFDDNTLLNNDETTLNDFLVSKGLKNGDREMYVKEQAQSNPKYGYEYEYNKIGSLYKAVAQRATDYEQVLKQEFGDNFFEQAKKGNNDILNNPDFNKYIALKEKQQSLSSKANGLINDSRYAEVKKDLQKKEDAQIKADAQAQIKKWYNVDGELNYALNKLAYAGGHIVKMFSEIPALATSIDKGYDWTDKLADWGDRFSNKLIDAVPTSSDLKTGFNNKVAKVGDYKVIIGDNGNPIDVRDKNNFKIPVSVSTQVLDSYNSSPDKYDIHNEYNPLSLADNGLNTVIDMGVMILGTKGAGLVGAGEKLQKLTSMGIAYQQTKRDVFNDAIKKGLDPRNADALSNIVGIAAGTSSALNPMEYNIASGKGLFNFLKTDGLSASKLALIKEGKLSVKDYAKEFVKEGIKNTIGENIEELGIENTTQALANNHFNSKISDTDMQDGGLDDNLHIFDKQGLETLLITAGASLLMTPIEIKSQTQTNQQEALKMAIENPDDFRKIRELQVKQGQLTQEQVDKETKIYDDVSKTYNAIKDDIKSELQPQLLALLTKKYNLSNKISEIKDEVLSAPYKAQLEEINKGIESISKGTNASETLVAKTEKPVINEKIDNTFEPATDVNLQVDEFGDGKTVIDQITEKPIIEEPKDLAVEKPAAEMDNAQLDEIFETKIANPDAELDNIFSALPLKNKVDESQITPNELVNTGQEQDVSKGLSGEYQNDKGLQQELGEGQVSGTEVPTEKVEEKIDNVEIKKLQEEIDSFDDEYNRLVDAVNKEDRKLNTPKSENEIKLNQLQDKINALIDKRNKLQEQQTPIQQSGEAGSGGVGGDMVEPKKQNYTQFAKENGYPDDYDTSFQAQLLGSRGLEGKRQSTRSIKEQDVAFQEMQKKKAEGKKAYEQAILDGKVIDPDSKLTREGILKRDYDFNKKELESKIANAENGVKNIEGLGKMAHLDNGKLKKGYQRAVDDYNETIAKHKESLDKLKTEYEQSLKETPKTETTENPALKDVESTAKALEGVAMISPQKIIQAAKTIDKIEYVEEQEARDIIESYTHYKSGNQKSPATRWAGWFQSVNAANKKFIIDDIQNDPKLRNAMLSLFYDVYKAEFNFNGTFDDFLNTEITLYRGITLADKKGVGQEGFSAFSTTKNRVMPYADEQALGKGQIKEIKITPKDTYGAVNYIGGGEVEVLVPTDFKKETLKDDFNRLVELNIGLFNEEQLNYIEKLYDKEDYISGMAFAKSVISSNPKKISEAYHKAKADGSNPELVKAVEEALKPTPEVSKPVSEIAKTPISKTETTENPIQIQAEEKLLAELVDDIEKGKNPNTTTTPKEKEQNSQSNFTADLSDANNSVESKISAIDGNIKKHGVIDNGSKSLIKSAIEKVDGLSVNNIFDIASRIAKFDKSEIRIEQIAEAIQYEAGRVENEKDVFSISLDDIQETLLSKYKQETPANKERMNDIGIADKTYTDRSDKLKSIKKTYELLSAESKALASQFIKRYYDTIKDDAKFTADEYLDLIDNIIKGKKIEDIAENIQNAIRVIEDKEAIELNKLPPIKEPLKDAENTTEALRRLTSNELNKIPLYSKQSVEKMIDESLQKNNEVRINIPFGSLYGLPDKVMTVVLNKDNTIVFFDKNGKETKGIKFDRENFNDFAFDVAKDQYKSQDSISKAYHKAKADGSNPELVKAVEDLLSKKDEKIDTEQRNVELINISKETAAEISPNKNVSASKASAIKDLLADKYSDLKEMEAGVLANLDGTESIDDLMEYVDWNRTTQKGGVYKGKGLKGSNIVKLIEKGYVEELSFIDDNITLTDKGKKFQEALKARIETRKGIKDGTDLFPKDAGLKGKELIGDALDRIVDKIGGKKNLTEQEKTTLTKDITDLAKGLLQEGKATIDNIIDKIIDAIKERLPNLDEKDVKDLADTIKAKVATNRAIEILKEKGLTFEQAKAEFDKRNILYNEDDIKDAWDGDKKEKQKTENKPKGEVVEKTVLNQRVFKGEISDELRRELKKHDLNRTTIPYHEARQIANDIIENVGLDTAFEAVERGDITGSPAAEIYNAKLEDLEKQINKETDADVLQDLIIEQARIFSELSDTNTKGGQFSSQMRYIYETSDIGYNVEKKISEWKEQFGEISPEVEQKFRDLDAQIKELNKQIVEAEQKAVEAEQKAILESIKASSGRKAKSTKVYGKDRVARGVDNLASLMGVKLSATGLNRPSLVKALTDIGVGLIEEGIATTENVVEKVKEYVKSKFGDKINVDDFADDINNAINLNTTQGKVKVPHSLIEKIVSEMDFSKPATENFKLLVETVMEELGSKFPDATERDFRDAITNYGKIVNLNADEIAQQIRKLKRIGKIESALEDIRNKKRPLRSGQQRDKLDAEERAKLKELREAMKELPMDEETLERELKTQLDAEKTRVRNQIEDLQREIDKNELTPRNARTVREDAELKELKEKRDKLKEEHDAKFKDDDYKEKKRLELAKKTAEKKIEDLQRRIREGDFSKAVRKPLVVDTELVKLKAQKLEAQEQYDKEFYKNKLKNRTKGELVKDSLWELWGITRALRATGEFSFVGVQGLINTIAHPMQSAKAFKNALTFFGSEKKTEDWLRKLKSQPYYPDLKASKLAITEPHAELNAREELFYSGWTNIIWNSIGTPLMLNKKAYEVWKNSNPFKAVERASVGYLDTIRVARYLDGVEMLKEKGITFNDNPQAYKEMADVINTFTGRGSIKFEALGGKQESSELLSKIFFSPKNWSSMIKTATPYALYHFGKKRAGAEAWKPSVAQKMALADFSKFVGFTITMLAMAAVHFNNDDDDETEVELDPRSSDFGKIRIGKKYIDPWGGRIQQVILISKLISQSVKTKDDEVLPLGIPYKTPTHENLLIRMALNKLSPSAQILDEYLSTTMKMNKETGEYERNIALERGGGKYEFKDEMLKSLYPIYWGTVADLYKDDPSALNGVLAFYAFFGGGVNVYNDKKDKETKKRSGLIQNH